MTSKKPVYFGRDLEAMSVADNYNNWVFSKIKKHLGTKVSEVGAGIGVFTKMILSSGSRYVYGYEPSENMYKLLTDNLKNHTNTELFNHEYNGLKSDTVIYLNVMEHIEHDDIEIKKAFSGLDNNGKIIIFVPALPWLYSHIDKSVGHYRRYYKKDIEKKVIDAGFKIEESYYMDILGIIPWYIFFVVMKININSGNVGLYDKAIIPIMRFIEKYIPIPIGKNIMIIGKK
ncbi:MAG: class I SAM-dependent methyltransferase [Methylococcales bacterium]